MNTSSKEQSCNSSQQSTLSAQWGSESLSEKIPEEKLMIMSWKRDSRRTADPSPSVAQLTQSEGGLTLYYAVFPLTVGLEEDADEERIKGTCPAAASPHFRSNHCTDKR